MFAFLLYAMVAVAYLAIGKALFNRGMAVVRANAFNDRDYFNMVIQSERPSLSMILPMIGVVVGWPLVLLIVALVKLNAPRVAEAPAAL